MAQPGQSHAPHAVRHPSVAGRFEEMVEEATKRPGDLDLGRRAGGGRSAGGGRIGSGVRMDDAVEALRVHLCPVWRCTDRGYSIVPSLAE